MLNRVFCIAKTTVYTSKRVISVALVISPMLLTVPSVSLAQTELEQFEEIAEALGEKMNQLFVAQNPALADVLPEVAWDDDFRNAAQCVLDKYRDEAGDEFVRELLARGQAFAATEITTLDNIAESLDFVPDGISDERQIAISAECRMTELTIKRMQESGFSDAVRNSAGG